MPLKDAFLAARHQGLWHDAAWQSTFAALEARLDQTLAGLGARPLAQPGMRFDARAHQAALGSHHETPAGTLLALLRQGYLLDGKGGRLPAAHASLRPPDGPPAPPAAAPAPPRAPTAAGRK